MADKTIIYFTNNKLDEKIFALCQRKLLEIGRPIISVSQKPIELGTNICVGEIGSSWLNIYKQLLIGTEAAKTKYVATAEHDCLYVQEHYDFIPPRDDTFYYNENVYLVEWGGNHPELNGMYSTYWEERRALSQMICNRELLIETLKRRLSILDGDDKLAGQIVFAGEPGVSKIRLVRKLAKDGSHCHLQDLLKEYLEEELSDVFRTKIPNLDIRHSTNFTGPKRGKNRCFTLPYWGEFKNIISIN
jgi:hypothetical protein